MPAARSVLVVDDEALLREILAEWLRMEGHHVLFASNGSEALQTLQSNPVDLMVTDVRMPVMDGPELLRRLSASENFTPAVIVVSGYSEFTPRAAYDLGVDVILPKPFTDEDVLSAVRRCFTPREVLWRSDGTPGHRQKLQATFSNVDAARQAGMLAFGRNGFCLRSPANLTEGPVRFTLDFPGERFRLDGHGLVRWTDPGEHQIGIEITGLEHDCVTRGVRLATGSGSRSCIPRSSR